MLTKPPASFQPSAHLPAAAHTEFRRSMIHGHLAMAFVGHLYGFVTVHALYTVVFPSPSLMTIFHYIPIIFVHVYQFEVRTYQSCLQNRVPIEDIEVIYSNSIKGFFLIFHVVILRRWHLTALPEPLPQSSMRATATGIQFFGCCWPNVFQRTPFSPFARGCPFSRKEGVFSQMVSPGILRWMISILQCCKLPTDPFLHVVPEANVNLFWYVGLFDCHHLLPGLLQVAMVQRWKAARAGWVAMVFLVGLMFSSTFCPIETKISRWVKRTTSETNHPNISEKNPCGSITPRSSTFSICCTPRL